MPNITIYLNDFDYNIFRNLSKEQKTVLRDLYLNYFHKMQNTVILNNEFKKRMGLK
jgi:hypothetical protein